MRAVESFGRRTLRVGRAGGLVGFLILAPLLAANAGAVRFQQAFIYDAEGTRSVLVDFPSEELQPAPQAGGAFVLEFTAEKLRYPVSSVMFGPSFVRKAPPAETPSAAVDVYLVAGEPPASLAAARARGHFVGSSIVAFRSARAAARLNLADALNALKPAGRFTLIVIPVGVVGRNPPFALAAAPAEIPAYANPGDRRAELKALMQPLWRGTHTREESVIFFAENKDTVPHTRLLRRPRRIERVFSYATGKDYIEGKDWSVEPDGTLRALPGTTLPMGTSDGLYPATVEGDAKSRPTKDGRTLLVTETWSYPLTVLVNYSHDEEWSGPIPVPTSSLPRTRQKLAAREPVTIAFIGDSIASPGRGSATVMKPPYGPTWPELFVSALRERFGGPIIPKNRALGSTVSTWGAANVDCVIAPARPDLVVIAFGMNDQRKTAPGKFRTNLETMIRQTRATNPDAEFMLVSSMVSNPIVADEQPLVEFREEMKKLSGNGIAIADVTAATRHLLQTKPFIDISVNNFNHPNDYLLRWYAQVAVALFGEPATEGAR